MPKQLSSAKRMILLEAPLELVHQQSQEWIEELLFWRDECAFLYTLIRNSPNSPLLKTRQAKSIEKQLLAISADRLDDMLSEISEHEKFLADVIEGKSKDEDLLRRRHRIISGSMSKLEQDFKKLKRQIFGLVKIKRDSLIIAPPEPTRVSSKLKLAKV